MQLVLGIGDSMQAQAAMQSGPHCIIALGDEPVPDVLAGATVARVRDPDEVAPFVHGMFGGHVSAVQLASCHIYRDHAVNGASALRDAVYDALCECAMQIPALWGNDIVDCMQGIVHASQNAARLLPMPDLHSLHVDLAPAVAVGAGPSLQDHLDDLRVLQGHVLIVACDAAVRPLLKADIVPNIVTPLERLRSTTEKLPFCDDAIFAGMPVVPPEAVGRFTEHVYVTMPDLIYDWLGQSRQPILCGSSTGTMAVAVALHLTKGPVYLVGHDLCMEDGASHIDGAASAKYRSDDVDHTVPGNDGKPRRTWRDWARFRNEIGNFCIQNQARVFNTNAATGKGAVIPYTRPARLPAAADCRNVMTYVMGKAPNNTDRLMHWAERAVHIVEDAQELSDNAAMVTTIDACGVDTLTHGRNADVFAYLLRSLYAQCSVERRLGASDARAMTTFRNGVHNVIRELMPFFVEVHHAARRFA